MIDYKLIKSKRKTISIILNYNGDVIVKAPLKTTKNEIENFIKEKNDWIKKHLEFINNLPKFSKKAFVNNESFLFLGENYKLKIDEKKENIFKFDNDNFIISRNQIEDANLLFIEWYKKESKKILTERCNYYSEITTYKPKSIKITSAQKRWGSCSYDDKICFSYRLVMAPIDVIDYVVLHELIHIVEKNHSKAFFDKLQKFMPDYLLKRKWLKENGNLLNI